VRIDPLTKDRRATFKPAAGFLLLLAPERARPGDERRITARRQVQSLRMRTNTAVIARGLVLAIPNKLLVFGLRASLPRRDSARPRHRR
jgi:hypothetical protein